jgi:hypothetical protein
VNYTQVNKNSQIIPREKTFIRKEIKKYSNNIRNQLEKFNQGEIFANKKR